MTIPAEDERSAVARADAAYIRSGAVAPEELRASAVSLGFSASKTPTPEQIAELEAELKRCLSDPAFRHREVRWLPSPGLAFNSRCEEFALRHGSFSLRFGATACSAGEPWTLVLDGDGNRAWSGHTDEMALNAAIADLDGEDGRAWRP